MGEILELEECEVLCGTHLKDACAKAIALADASSKAVHFKLNDTDVTVEPGELVDGVVARWDRDREAAYQTLINSDEYKEQKRLYAEKEKAKEEAHHIEKAQTEVEMREAEVPWVRTKEQLIEYIESLVNRPHEYGTCVYALSMAAVAAFYYVGYKLGVTGFQVSCADLDIFRRTRSLKGPFILLKAEDMLYPQYNLMDNLLDAMKEWGPWAKDQAIKKLAEVPDAHPRVLAHWEMLAKKEVKQ
jgi:hypothetical protein